jgi:crossover junction endodeoxyribonuclease RusA
VIAARTPSVALDPAAVALAITVPGEPVSKERPRSSLVRGRIVVRTAPKTSAWEQVIALHARQTLRGAEPDATSTFGVALMFVSGDRRQRDIDNLVKLALDALNEVLWKSDHQIQELCSRLVRGGRVPRTEIVVYRINPFEENRDP